MTSSIAIGAIACANSARYIGELQIHELSSECWLMLICIMVILVIIVKRI